MLGILQSLGFLTAAAATSDADVSSLISGSSIMRKAWRMEKAGRISDLKLVEEPIAYPASGHVRVAVKAIGLNAADIFAIIGLYAATPKGSLIPGLEYSGVVESIGDGCQTSLRVGDKVYGFTRFGSYVSHLNVNEYYVRKLPEKWTFAEGASFVVQGLTAWHAMVELGSVKKGQTVLVHSAAGGVGQLALELCKHLQAFPIATIGSNSKVNVLKERFGLSDEQIIVRETNAKNFARQLNDALAATASRRSSSREGYDCILDALGGICFKEGYRKLARGGRMITFGAADYLAAKDGPSWIKIIPKYLSRPMIDPGDLCSDNKSIMGFNLIFLTDLVKELNAELDDMLRYDWRPPHVGSKYSFQRLPEAVRALQSGLTVGKVCVLLDEEHEKGTTAQK